MEDFYKEYTYKFKSAKKRKTNNEKWYVMDNKLKGLPITSVEHPNYFEFGKEWEKVRSGLDKPLLDNAYFSVGDVVSFVKQNTYSNNDILSKKPHLLKHKRLKSYTIASNYRCREDEGCICDGNDVYYENVICVGTITEVKTSDSGDGEIIYMFSEIQPPCPEVNPHVRESDIISNFIVK